jgi:hypothetical protein
MITATPFPVRASLIAFISGAASAACSVVWVHRAVHGTALQTALVSGIQAICSVAGIGESVRDWRAAPAFVVGYSLGAYFAMVLA